MNKLMALISGQNKQQLFIKGASLLLIVASIAAIGLHLLNPSHAATDGASLSITGVTGTYKVGDTVTVTINEDSGTVPISLIDATLTYPVDSLSFNNSSSNIINGDNFNQYDPPISSSNGILEVTRPSNPPAAAGVPNPGVTGAQQVVTLKFTALKAGTASIAYTAASKIYTLAPDASGVPVNLYTGTSSGAAVVVDDPNATPLPTPTPTPVPTSVPAQPPSYQTTPKDASLTFTPATGTYKVGDTVTVTINEDSGTVPISLIDATLTYPVDSLSFNNSSSNIINGDNFNQYDPPISSSNGILEVTRPSNPPAAAGVPNPGVTGAQQVVTLKFTALKAGTASIAYTAASKIYTLAPDASGVPADIYDSGTNSASYTIQPASVSPTPTPTKAPTPTPTANPTPTPDSTATPTRTAQPTSAPTPTPAPTTAPVPVPTPDTTTANSPGSPTLTYTVTDSGSASNSSVSSGTNSNTGTSTPANTPITAAPSVPLQISDPVTVTPVVSDLVASDGTARTVTKVTYYLDDKLLAVVSKAPFSYSVDATHLRNGNYTLGVVTSYSDGTNQTNTQKLAVQNPYDWTQFSLDAKHYPYISIPSTILIIAALVVGVVALQRRRQWAFGGVGTGPGSRFNEYQDHDLHVPVTSSLPTPPTSTIHRIEPTVIAPTQTNSSNDSLPFTPSDKNATPSKSIPISGDTDSDEDTKPPTSK